MEKDCLYLNTCKRGKSIIIIIIIIIIVIIICEKYRYYYYYYYYYYSLPTLWRVFLTTFLKETTFNV